MIRARNLCDHCRKRQPLAILTEVRPAIYVCDPCLREADRARDQYAAESNVRPARWGGGHD